MSTNSETPTGSEVEEWMNKSNGISEPNEKSQNVVVLNIDDDGFLIPSATTSINNNTNEVEATTSNDDFFSNTEYVNGNVIKN